MFRYHNNRLPPPFLNLFLTNSLVHRYDTTTFSNIIKCIPVVRTSRNSQSFTKDLESRTVFLHLLQTFQAFLSLSGQTLQIAGVSIKIVTELV